MSVVPSIALALSWILLLRSGTLFWKSSSCLENSSTGEAALLESWARASPPESASIAATSAAAPATANANGKRAKAPCTDFIMTHSLHTYARNWVNFG